MNKSQAAVRVIETFYIWKRSFKTHAADYMSSYNDYRNASSYFRMVITDNLATNDETIIHNLETMGKKMRRIEAKVDSVVNEIARINATRIN